MPATANLYITILSPHEDAIVIPIRLASSVRLIVSSNDGETNRVFDLAATRDVLNLIERDITIGAGCAENRE